jgi:hypothetical protein
MSIQFTGIKRSDQQIFVSCESNSRNKVAVGSVKTEYQLVDDSWILNYCIEGAISSRTPSVQEKLEDGLIARKARSIVKGSSIT